MERKSFAAMNCSIAQCLEVVGEWWSILILRDALLGITKFDDFHRRLGISKNILSNRLSYLVEQGVMQKQQYSSKPVRHEYLLTSSGRDLWMVLAAMRQWGDKYAAPDGPPLEMVHRRCSQTSTVIPTCSCCGDILVQSDVKMVPGPGSLDRPSPLS